MAKSRRNMLIEAPVTGPEGVHWIAFNRGGYSAIAADCNGPPGSAQAPLARGPAQMHVTVDFAIHINPAPP